MPEPQTNPIPYGLKMPWQDASSSAPSTGLPYGLSAPWEDASAKAASPAPTAVKAAQPAQPAHTVGYNKALTQAQQNPNSVGAGLANAFNPTTAFADNRPSVGAFNSTLHGFLYNTLPVLQGTTNAIGTAIQNIVSKTGAVKGTGYSSGEAYSAGRDASQNALDQYQQAHPVLGPATNLAGALSNPVTDLIPGLSEAKSVTTGNKVVRAAIPVIKAGIKSGIAGTAMGVGEGVSRGETAPQIAENAAAYGVPAALAGATGRAVSPLIGKGVSAINSRVSAPALQTATKIGGAGLIGATGGAALGLPGAILSGRPDAIVNNAEWGALIGAGYGAKGINKAAKEPAAVMPPDNASAVQHIVDTVGNGDYGKTASALEASSAPTVAHAIEPSQRTGLMQTSGAQHEANLTDLQGAVAQHQAPEEVKGRLKNSVEQTAGIHPDEVSENVTVNPHVEQLENSIKQAQAQQESNPYLLRANADEAVGRSTGIKPSEAELGWGAHVQGMQNENSAKWQGIEKDAEGNHIPLTSPEHERLLANEPVVVNAMRAAKSTLGADATVEIPNPKFNPNAEQPITPKEVGDNYSTHLKDYLEAQGKGEAPSSQGAWPTPEEIADWKNQKSGITGEPETLTVPTRKAWLYTKRNLNALVSRHGDTGAALPSHVSNVQNSEVNDLTKKVNAANKAEIPGLEEAQKASHEQFGGEEAEDHGFTISNAARGTESPEALNARYGDLNDTQKAGLKNGYLRGMHRDMLAATNDPAAMDRVAKKYSNELHSKYQDTIFSSDEKAAIQEQMKGIKDKVAAAKVKGGTPIGDTISNAQKLIKSEKISDFNHAYDNDAEHQHLYKDAYTDHINNLVNSVESSGNVEPSHLKDLEHLVTSDFHKEVQDKLYGPEKAEQLRTAIKKEINSASVGKEISGFKPTIAEPKKFFNMVPSTLFGMAGAKHTPSGAFEGAMAGAKIAKGEETIHEVAHAINQSKMSPGTARAIGNHLASSPQDFAKEVRANEAKRRNMPMSKSDIGKRVSNRTALGIGLLAGKKISNALTGVDTNQ